MKNTGENEPRNVAVGFALRVVFWIAASVALFFYFKSTQ
jgi:hypothetical protein